MDIGITLPTNIPDVDGGTVMEWARRAESAGFASVGMGERLGYDGYDWAVALSAAAAVTTRVQLVSSVVILPLRSVGLAAKESLSVHRLSGGRLSFGVGLGGHDREDFVLADAPWEGRVERFERALVDLRRVWAGEPLIVGQPPIGPKPGPSGPPELIIGGFAPQAVRRAARYADGLNVHDIVGDVDAAAASFELMRATWNEHGRPGQPRLIAGFFFALGPQAEEHVNGYFHDYFAAYGEAAVEAILSDVTTHSEAGIRDKFAQFEAIGCDLVLLTPVCADLDQVDRAGELLDWR